MRHLILDIETIAHPDAGPWVEPVVAAANLKDPVKIAASIAERTAERDDKLGLDPDCCRIVALGFVDPAKGDFALRPGSPALELGFVPIDLSGVGPRR